MIGRDTEEVTTVEDLPDGTQRITTERNGPFGRQVNVSVSGRPRASRNPTSFALTGAGAGNTFVILHDDFDEDPFDALFHNHQRFMRFNRPNIMGQLVDLEALLLILMGRGGAQQQGLPREAIEKIRKTKFRRNPQTRPGEEEKCPICITEFADGEEMRQLPCSHNFHPECVDTWLVQNSSCPICKADMREHLEGGRPPRL